jgi:hypothetical protein
VWCEEGERYVKGGNVQAGALGSLGIGDVDDDDDADDDHVDDGGGDGGGGVGEHEAASVMMMIFFASGNTKSAKFGSCRDFTSS